MPLQDDHRRRLARLFIIANLLEEGRAATRDGLAAACGCSRRTIARDLDLLKEAGVELAYDVRRHTYALEAPLPFQAVQFSLAEVMALAVAQEALLSEKGLPFEASLRAAFGRVTARVPSRLREALAETQLVVSFGAHWRRDYTGSPAEQLTEAARQRQTVEMHYHTLSRDEWTLRRVDPYHVVERKGYLNLVGYCHRRREVREFALDRIRAAHTTSQTFTRSEDFCLEKYMSGSVATLRGAATTIIVRFEPALAPYARRRQWEFPHEFEELDDGGVLLRGVVSGTEGIRAELLSWGAGFEVLEPQSLRETIRRTGEAIAAKHEDISENTARLGRTRSGSHPASCPKPERI